jgi:leader peptidase (prepilin peptidase)/N-methyltransferase
MPILIAAVALLGLAIGSFLNVVIYRLPVGKSLVRPPSQCPTCAQPIRTRHNIPVVGWLALRGKCAHCRTAISLRYPLVELGCALLFVAMTLRIAQLHVLPALPAYLYFAAIGIALSMIDIDTHRLPNAIVLPSLAVVLVLLSGAAAWNRDWTALERTIIGAAALFSLYLIMAFAYPAGMGFGDVKLSATLGALLGFLSWSTLAVGTFAGFLLGGIAGVAVIISRRGTGKTALPFGPFMIAGALLAIFAGAPITRFYLDFLSV